MKRKRPARARQPARSARPKPKASATKKTAGSPSSPQGHVISPKELARLQNALREAQETLDAIRSGAVDAVVVSSSQGSQIYSLAGAEQPYRIYVERMQEGAVTVSSDGLVLYCNKRFADMLGQPLEKVISSNFRDHVSADAWNALRQAASSNTDAVKLEQSLTRADGAPLPVLFTASPLPLEGQHVICLVVADLTEQHQHAQLRLAKEVAEKASAAKDAFLATLSHELRTPLNPALMRAISLEQDASLPESLRADVHLIRRNIELEARLIDDLLDLTRISQGKLQLHLDHTEINTVVRRALEVCEGEVRARDIDVELACQAAADRTVGDAVRIQQAVWNLINNAAKFTPRRGRIRISTTNPRVRWIAIQVDDTGIGFAAEDGQKIFDAFEQGSREITRKFGGLGLGLAITRSIVAAHGGTIRAESPGPDQGSTFTIELPLRTEGASSAPPRPIAALRRSLAHLRVLLVEDHRDTRTTMETLLRRDGCRITVAANAAEALEFAAKQRFDVLIADLGLPDMSGLELMRKLHATYRLRGIATSGYGMEEDVAECLAAGFDYHLTKPVRIEQLRRHLADLAESLGHKSK